MIAPLLATLVVEHEPPRFSQMGEYLTTWLQDAGGFAAAALFLILLAWLIRSASQRSANEPPLPGLQAMFGLGAVALVIYLIAAVCFGFEAVNQPPPPPAERTDAPRSPGPPPTIWGQTANWCLTIGGGFALVGLAIPFLIDWPRLSGRRILALARLSFKEAVRRRVVWVFLAFLIVFLFPPKWFFPIKAEDEIRTNIAIIYWAMRPLLLLTAGLLAAFSIPTDIKNQTLHTIVTKPVERFEIVLGRFLGFMALVSVVLIALVAFSLLLISTSGVSPEAAEESYKARVPLHGELSFRNLKTPDKEFKGESVGREWEYRSYIAGGERSPHRAVWAFTAADLQTPLFSPKLGDLTDGVPCEFTFDIFRTTKGVEGAAVSVSLTFITWKYGPEPDKPLDATKRNEYRSKLSGTLPLAPGETPSLIFDNAQPDGGDKERADFAKLDRLAEEYGYYEYRSKPVADEGHTQGIRVPAGLFRNAMSGAPTNANAPLLWVYVKCDSRTQYLGVAKRDLYLLASNESFGWNFFKGALGLWMVLALVIGIAVTCSTYLSGVIGFLVTVFLFIAGLFQEFIQRVARGVNEGGGPLESFTRLVRNDNITIQLDPTPTVQAAQAGDVVFRWGLRRIINVIPDVTHYDWSAYVANGFNISMSELTLSFLFLMGYLLPWAMLAYYLMKSREIAN